MCPSFAPVQWLSAHGSDGGVASCRFAPDTAIRFLPRDCGQTELLRREIVSHRALRHPQIIAFKKLVLTEEHICISMEFANNGTLTSMVEEAKRLREPLSRWFFQQIILAVDYCHQLAVSTPDAAKRDVRPDNILLHKPPHLRTPLAKLCDFAYSSLGKLRCPKETVPTLSTLSCIAPELIRGGSHANYDRSKADVWSCGATLYFMLTGKPLFDSTSQLMGSRWHLPAQIAARLSPDCLNILHHMLKVDPAERMSLQDIIRHPWFLMKLPAGALELNQLCLGVGRPDSGTGTGTGTGGTGTGTGTASGSGTDSSSGTASGSGTGSSTDTGTASGTGTGTGTGSDAGEEWTVLQSEKDIEELLALSTSSAAANHPRFNF